MSSEDERDQRFREIRRTTPEWWRDVYIDEYIGDDEPERTEAREDFDAMIQHIERRVLARQPCWMCHGLPCDGVDQGVLRCCNQKQPSDRCATCQARAVQTQRGNAQETSG